MPEKFGVMVRSDSGPGILHQLTGVIAKRGGNISSVEISENTGEARTYFEVEFPGDSESLVADLEALSMVREAGVVKTLQVIYGKRIIIMGGGAQVGQVAIGAISEADRHNIRREPQHGRQCR